MPTPASPPASPRPARSRRTRLIQAVLGLLAGAAITEGAFHLRDHGAFPHLNVYVPDPSLGVRLRPHAEQRVAFNGNPVTRVRINGDGFRGADFPPPSPGEILIVGDSQVFGLGVEESETFSADLAARAGRTVLDLGVPTYGPPEYNAILEEVLTRRAQAGALVIYTVNLANDLFEGDRSNAERHAVWDGWAVRAETAPERAPWFPGRALVFRESHAVFALRTFLHRDSGAAEAGFASEGTWQDLIGAAARRKAERSPAELDALIEGEKAAQRALERAAVKAYPAVMSTREGKAYQKHHGNPEDIVVRRNEVRYAEGARHHEVTVTQLVEGSKIRKRIEASLRRHAEKEIETERARAVLASLRERDAIEKKIADVRARTEAALRTLSPLRGPLERAKAICAARGAKLVVLVLPIDVEVSSEEWAKYDREPLDLGEVRALTDDLMATAASLDLPALDAHDTLAAAEPGAFLNADLHMTPKGHRAVGKALAQKIASLRADR